MRLQRGEQDLAAEQQQSKMGYKLRIFSQTPYSCNFLIWKTGHTEELSIELQASVDCYQEGIFY